MKHSLLSILLSAFFLFTINGCSTVEGIGKDLQGAGRALSKEAKNSKSNKKPPANATQSQDRF